MMIIIPGRLQSDCDKLRSLLRMWNRRQRQVSLPSSVLPISGIVIVTCTYVFDQHKSFNRTDFGNFSFGLKVLSIIINSVIIMMFTRNDLEWPAISITIIIFFIVVAIVVVVMIVIIIIVSTRNELECPVCFAEMKPPVHIWQCAQVPSSLWTNPKTMQQENNVLIRVTLC